MRGGVTSPAGPDRPLRRETAVGGADDGLGDGLAGVSDGGSVVAAATSGTDVGDGLAGVSDGGSVVATATSGTDVSWNRVWMGGVCLVSGLVKLELELAR